MEGRGFVVYRLRGHYYRIFRKYNSSPQDIGRDIIKWIPSNPEKFQEWKKSDVTAFSKEEIKMRRLAEEDPLQDAQNMRYWLYHGRPSRNLFVNAYQIGWFYIIDFDEDVLRVSSHRDLHNLEGDVNQRYITHCFRLDNIPRWLFNDNSTLSDSSNLLEPAAHAMFAASRNNVPAEYWADHLQNTPEPDPEMLKIYEGCSPQPMTLEKQDGNLSTWGALHLVLLRFFFRHFIRSFQDLATYERKSSYVFRQLGYAVVFILQGIGNVRFQAGNPRDFILTPYLEDVTPDWEPPDTNIYWMGEVLIVLDEHIEHDLNRRAAIGRAMQFVGASEVTSDVTAVILCIRCVVLVKISRSTHGLGVLYSNTLPLFTQDMESNSISWGGDYTPGIIALISLFSSQYQALPAAEQFPRNLPTEICQQIFDLSDSTSQHALELSCRLFHEVARDRPRLGDWTLLKYTGDSKFIAVSSSDGSVQAVSLVPSKAGLHRRGTAFEAVIWKGPIKFQLEIPLFSIR